jgi:hypothetical protein
MKKLYVLCVITLAAVFIDIVFFHSSTVNAQAPKRYEVRTFNPANGRMLDSPGWRWRVLLLRISGVYRFCTFLLRACGQIAG